MTASNQMIPQRPLHTSPIFHLGVWLGLPDKFRQNFLDSTKNSTERVRESQNDTKEMAVYNIDSKIMSIGATRTENSMYFVKLFTCTAISPGHSHGSRLVLDDLS
jgi:hypothetical protein